eukprot:Gb_31415 [translate_table: standard]
MRRVVMASPQYTELNDAADFDSVASQDGFLSICGFGSLLSERSARSTFPDLQNFRVAVLRGFRRVFAHTAPVFFERGIANMETKEISSLSVEPSPEEFIVVTVFEIHKSEIPAFIEREHEFRFLVVVPEDPSGKRFSCPAVICSRYSDEEYRQVRCQGSEEMFFQRYGRHNIDKIWRDDILPCRVYLRHWSSLNPKMHSAKMRFNNSRTMELHEWFQRLEEYFDYARFQDERDKGIYNDAIPDRERKALELEYYNIEEESLEVEDDDNIEEEDPFNEELNEELDRQPETYGTLTNLYDDNEGFNVGKDGEYYGKENNSEWEDIDTSLYENNFSGFSVEELDEIRRLHSGDNINMPIYGFQSSRAVENIVDSEERTDHVKSRLQMAVHSLTLVLLAVLIIIEEALHQLHCCLKLMQMLVEGSFLMRNLSSDVCLDDKVGGIIGKGVESGSDKGGLVIARLLVPLNQNGCLLGKGGTIITKIRKASGANIHIFGKDQGSKWASENEEVVQVINELEVVRDALVHITTRLCNNIPQTTSVGVLLERVALRPAVGRFSIFQSMRKHHGKRTMEILSIDV